MFSVDEDLRHGAAPIRAIDHRLEPRAVHRHVDFAEIGALGVQQHLRTRAIGAEGLRINFDLGHTAILSSFRPAYRNPTKQSQICRSEEHTSELQSLMRISYAVFCLKKKKKNSNHIHITQTIITN